VKKYRVEILDTKLTKQRILNESRNMARAAKHGINTPYLLFVDTINRKIYMQYVETSVPLKQLLKEIYFSSNITFYEDIIQKIVNHIGENIAKMHNSDIIHGDLTTSNMLVRIK
jgi:TP53 regulating kinase-like protein